MLGFQSNFFLKFLNYLLCMLVLKFLNIIDICFLFLMKLVIQFFKSSFVFVISFCKFASMIFFKFFDKFVMTF